MKKLILTAALVACGTSTYAQSNCGPRDGVINRLATKYGETRHSIGLGANNSVVEVFGNESTGSWSITVTLPTGMTCLMASGEAFEVLQEALGEDM